CPRCGVDLEDQWDYDEHLEMHVEADRNKEAIVHDARQTGERLLNLIHLTNAPQQFDDAKCQDIISACSSI
ncbi:hypothetical protein Tco_1309116, partial [Tanacetum coccineum]